LRIFELDPRKFETITPDITPPTYTPRFRTHIPTTREDSIEVEKNDKSDYRIYTDGSGHDGKAGAAAVLYKKGAAHEQKSLQFHLGNLTRHTTYEAEVIGAILATWLLHSTPGSARSTVSIYSDNQAFIRSSTRRATGPGRYLVDAFRSATDNIKGPLKVNWISAHSEVQGNERADALAKQAAQGQSSNAADLPPLLCHPLPFSASAEKQAYTLEINTMWSEMWQSSPRRARMDHIDKSFPFKNFRKIQYQLTRAQSSLLLQLCSGHIPLNAHLYRLNCSNTDKCTACSEQIGAPPAAETITHFLFHCPAYQNERHDLDNALGPHRRDLESILKSKKRTKDLLRYIGRTKRLKKLLGETNN